MLPQHQQIIKPRELWWERNGVFNPAAISLNDKTYLLYRAVGSDNISRFGLAISSNGQEFQLFDQPIFEGDPDNSFERLGVEDPRIVKIGRDIYVTYVAASVYPADYRGIYARSLNTPDVPWRARIGVLKTRDLQQFHRLDNWLSEVDTKDAVLFPAQIQGRYWLIYRIVPAIYLVSSSNLKRWENSIQIVEPKSDWEETKIGAACPPIATERGWLLFYHGVDRHACYRIGALLLNKDNPALVMERCVEPLIEPTLKWEKEGRVNNVIFVTGAVVKQDEVWLYYGAADYSIGLIKLSFDYIYERLKPISGQQRTGHFS